jgi:hypothetical protein
VTPRRGPSGSLPRLPPTRQLLRGKGYGASSKDAISDAEMLLQLNRHSRRSLHGSIHLLPAPKPALHHPARPKHLFPPISILLHASIPQLSTFTATTSRGLLLGRWDDWYWIHTLRRVVHRLSPQQQILLKFPSITSTTIREGPPSSPGVLSPNVTVPIQWFVWDVEADDRESQVHDQVP